MISPVEDTSILLGENASVWDVVYEATIILKKEGWHWFVLKWGLKILAGFIFEVGIQGNITNTIKRNLRGTNHVGLAAISTSHRLEQICHEYQAQYSIFSVYKH